MYTLLGSLKSKHRHTPIVEIEDDHPSKSNQFDLNSRRNCSS